MPNQSGRCRCWRAGPTWFRNEGLRADDFTPTVVLTLEDLTGQVDSPQRAINVQRNAITANIGPIDTDTPTTVCEHAGTTIIYLLEGRHVSSLVVAVEDNIGNIWAATVTMQTTQPGRPGYLGARRILLTGFRVKIFD